MRVLVLNPGSSTLKASLVVAGGDAGVADMTIAWPPDAHDADAVVGAALGALGTDADAVGYRVVHGGDQYRAAARVDDALIAAVERLDQLAPLHNRRAADVMRAGLAAVPRVPHIAAFDSAFHATLPEDGWRYPLPADWVARWAIRRFGFHGLSVAWSTRRAAELLGRPAADMRLVVAHLGSGCSVTAVDRGRSVDTSMGFTPYEGLMMGTRAGSVDPGILLHMVSQGLAHEELSDGLAHRSGLLAVGGTSDVRELEPMAASGDPAARLALAMFGRRAAAAIAAAATALPALDGLVFTGGIGEHAASIRADIVRRLALLRVPTMLREVPADAVVAEGPPAVVVVIAREDRMIADEAAALLGDQPPPAG